MNPIGRMSPGADGAATVPSRRTVTSRARASQAPSCSALKHGRDHERTKRRDLAAFVDRRELRRASRDALHSNQAAFTGDYYATAAGQLHVRL